MSSFEAERCRFIHLCNICLINPSLVPAGCHHSFCGRCSAQWLSSQPSYSLRISCPLCSYELPDRNIKPSTAGLVVLNLSGENPYMVWEELKSLQRLAGLVEYPIRSYFDRITATGAGKLRLYAVLSTTNTCPRGFFLAIDVYGEVVARGFILPP